MKFSKHLTRHPGRVQCRKQENILNEILFFEEDLTYEGIQKLAAIVLAGVMALAVLTGCSDSDKTTFHKQLTDALSNAKVTAEYNTADVAKAEKIAQLWDSYAAEI